MNKKELGQIRRRYTTDKNDISIVCGCFVNDKKEIVSEFEKSLLDFPETEAEHYLSLFKKTLGGNVGRNQFEVAVNDTDLLHRLVKSNLTDRRSLSDLYNTIIENYSTEDSYLILAMHDTYTIPKKKVSVDSSNEDALSDNIYSYILVSVCPVKLTKPTLSFFAKDREFHNVEPDLAVGSPVIGFMYPGFVDGGSDLSSAQYYSKDPTDLHNELINTVFGSPAPESSEDIRQAFQDILSDSLDASLTFDVVQTIHDNLVQQMVENKEPVEVSRREISSLLESCNVPKEKLADFEKFYNEQFGKGRGLDAANVVDQKKFEIVSDDVTLNVNPERSDLIEMKRIDGRRCVLIHIEGDVTVNGVTVTV